MPRASEIVQLVGRPESAVMCAVREVVDIIDASHSLPRTTRVMVRESRSLREDGGYLGSRTGACIAVSRFAPEPHLTFAHEFGHLVDNRMLQPLPEAFASEYEVHLEALRESWQMSAAVRHIQGVLTRYGRRISASGRAHLVESLRPHELFARTYAQWLTLRSKAPVLLEELQRRLVRPTFFAGIPCVFQWDEDSFKPIMNAVDELLKAKRML